MNAPLKRFGLRDRIIHIAQAAERLSEASVYAACSLAALGVGVALFGTGCALAIWLVRLALAV